MVLKIDPAKKETLVCPVCSNVFEKYIKDATQTCSRLCGAEIKSRNTMGIHKKGKKIKERDNEREEEDGINCQHRQVIMGTDCEFGEGFIL